MGQTEDTEDRDGGITGAETAFADPAFAPLRAQAAPFAILRAPADAAPGEVLWANAAAAAFWGAGTAADLAQVLFGSGGHGGWLDGLARGLVPGRPPRLARAGLGRGFRMRAHTALLRAWSDRDGATLIGLAVPDAEASPAQDGADWRRPAWPPADPVPEGPTAPEEASGEDAEVGPADDAAGDGLALARRSQLAVLRDRLGRALDGAMTLRLLWRTDEAGSLASIDAGLLARLGSPLRFEGRAWPDAVSPFDPDGAGRLGAALGSRATFAGVAFDLPVADAAATVPMALSASPVYGPERRFAGFRGFGTVDLGRLALAERRGPAMPAEGSDEPVPPAREATAEAPVAVDPQPSAPEPSGPVSADEPAAPTAEPVAPTAAATLPVEAKPPANVVHLRAFQAMASGRFGVVSAPAEAPAEPPAEPVRHEPGEGTPAAAVEAPGDGAVGEDGPLSDQLAFLALGEALRARIGAPPAAAEPPAASAPSPAAAVPAAAEAAAAGSATLLLDRLPAAVLATVGGELVFANPAAAARLGHPDVGALLAAEGGALVSAAEADRIALRDARGRDVALAARRVEVPWAGESALLWLLAEPESPASARAGAVERADDRSVELLDRVDDAVALLDGAGRLRRLNRRGEAWFGHRDPEAAPGRSLADLLAPESRAGAIALLGEVRDQRDGLGAPPLRRGVVARTAEGAALPMLLTLGRLGASGFYATLRDVSASPRADAGPAEAERPGAEPAPPRPARDPVRDADRLPDLLAKVSHEIRTPLGAIVGFAEVMMDERFGPLGNPRYKDYMRDIHAAGAQVVALVEDLLDLSRIEAGHLDLDVAAVDINRIVTEAVAQMQPDAHRGRVIVRTSLAGRVPSVLADERSARQIVRNLLSNAVKFNEPGGQVIVSTALGESGGVLLRVRDTGVGMSDEAIAAAMEPFGGLITRAPAQHGLAGGAGGNGLGLPLTRALVGANGASMTIRSRPREGTLVEVSFAAAEEGGARRPA